jgi:hypothetical protein
VVEEKKTEKNMKYALVNGDKKEPQPGLKGICESCQSDMLSKCGRVRIPHWAHKSRISCDPWWENETEWHRVWKNHFPMEWQEKIHIDSITGEKHIADIKSDNGLVIEFQHSAIQSNEIKSREAFYKNMVWVVDGTRLKRDYPRFCRGFDDFRPTAIKGFFISFFPNECLPENWLGSSVPVYFDFQSNNSDLQPDERRSPLWCLFPDRMDGHALIAGVLRKQFIEFASTAPHLLFAREHLNCISEHIRLHRENAILNVGRKYLHAYPRAVKRYRL